MTRANGGGLWRVSLRFLGWVIGGGASLVGVIAALTRLDGPDELRSMFWVDALVGLALAVAVVLIRISHAGETPRHGLIALYALLVWAVVSGALAYWHVGVYRIRTLAG